jgi:hypothetical protein
MVNDLVEELQEHSLEKTLHPCLAFPLCVGIAIFIQARRENHEVFSLVDERRALPLAFNILTDSLLTGISNGTAEVSITLKCSLLPESFFQLVFVLLPKLNR